MLHCSICLEYTNAHTCCGQPTLDLNTLPIIAQSNDEPAPVWPGPSDFEDDLPELQNISG